MSIDVVHALQDAEWRRFVDELPAGNIFHTPEMFQVFGSAEGHRPTLWAAVGQNRSPLALLLPVQITLHNGPLRELTTRAVVYGSVLWAPEPEGIDALRMLLQVYRQEAEDALFTELRNLSDLGTIQPLLQECGFRYGEQLDYLIDLTHGPEQVLRTIGRRTRKRIRRSLRQGELVISEIERRRDVALFYDLVSRSYANARVPLADRSLFEAAFDQLYPKGMVKFLLAWMGDACVAASAELLYKDAIFGWYSGVDRDYSSCAPNELLMWHILEWGARHGYRVYDFGGAGRPDQEYGVRDFKAKFGGELVSYGRNTCVHSPTGLAISRCAYAAYRTLLMLRPRGSDSQAGRASMVPPPPGTRCDAGGSTLGS